MRCGICPLMEACNVSYEGEYEYRCAVDASYVDPDEGACNRTNKWINSQDKDVLNAKWTALTDQSMNEYLTFMEKSLKNEISG